MKIFNEVFNENRKIEKYTKRSAILKLLQNLTLNINYYDK